MLVNEVACNRPRLSGITCGDKNKCGIQNLQKNCARFSEMLKKQPISRTMSLAHNGRYDMLRVGMPVYSQCHAFAMPV